MSSCAVLRSCSDTIACRYKDGLQGGNPVDGNPRTGIMVPHHGDLAYAAAFVMHNIPLLTNLE